MSRKWYVTPTRVRPGFYIPGRFNSSDGYWMGPSTGHGDIEGEMGKVRGPFPDAKEAAEAARVWREVEGKHSDIWLCLVEGDVGEVTHCNKYDPARFTEKHVGRLDAHAAFDDALAVMEDPAPVVPIVRRPTPPWRPGDSSMLYIPLSPIRGSRFDLIERAQALAREECAATGHSFRLGGRCITCDARCPHPEFADEGHIRRSCTTCGCLEPIPGTPDHYEVPLGGVQPCLLGTYPEEEALLRTSREDWLRYRKEAAEGTFKPKDWNWAVGENAVEVADPSKPEGYRFEKRVCIFIMGDGSQQCLAMFPLEGAPSPEQWDLARQMIRTTFGVERIINGVG